MFSFMLVSSANSFDSQLVFEGTPRNIKLRHQMIHALFQALPKTLFHASAHFSL